MKSLLDLKDELGKLLQGAGNFIQHPIASAQQGITNWASQPQNYQKAQALQTWQPLFQPIQTAQRSLASQNITTPKQFAYKIMGNAPQQFNQYVQNVSNKAKLPQIVPSVVGSVGSNLLKGPSTFFQKKSNFQHAGDILSTVGALKTPAEMAVGSVINPIFKTGESLLKGKLPTGKELTTAVSQGIDFGALYGPLNKIVEPLLNPITKKIAPEAFGNINSWARVIKNAPPEAKGQLVKMAAFLFGRETLAKVIQGGVGMGAYNAMQPAKNNQERIQNTISGVEQGAAFAGGQQLLGTGASYLYPRAKGMFNIVGDKTKGLPMGMSVKPITAQERAKLNQPPVSGGAGAFRKEFPDSTNNPLYNEMKKAQQNMSDKVTKEINGKNYKSDAEIPTKIKNELDNLKSIWENKAKQWEDVYVNKQDVGAGLTQEQARQQFQESWNKSYGNRPQTINEPSALQQRKIVGKPLIDQPIQPPVEGGVGGTPPLSPTVKSVSGGEVGQGVVKPQLQVVSKDVANRNMVGQLENKLPSQVGTVPIKSELQKSEVQPQQVRGNELPNNQNISSPPPIIPPSGDPVQKIIQALKEAKPLEQKQGNIYAKIRSQQAGAISGIGKNIPGEAGFHAQLGSLKGEMPKVTFESIRKQVTQPDIDALFNNIEQSNITPFEKITAKSGLAKLIGAEGGTVPVQSELKLLNEIFPPEFIQSVLDKRSTMQKLFSVGAEALNLPRAMMATADLSAPLRQGAFLVGRPKQWLPAFSSMFKYAASENSYQGLLENIKSRPTYQLMRENKLAITDMSPIMNSREEAFMSNLSEKIPIFGKLAKGSNRAYSGFLNKLRADTFDSLVKSAKDQGLDVNTVVPDIAKFVNSATGRGDVGATINKASAILNGAFFSPRLMQSRLNLLNPLWYTKLDPFVRKEALKSLLTFAGTGLTILGLSKLGGASVSTDVRNADFGKIKVGNTRFDIWAGFQQYFVIAGRLLTGQMVSSTTGKEFNLGEGYKPTTRFDIIQRFFESKESPIASFASSLLKGQTNMGEKLNIPVEVIDRFIPMVTQDIYDLYRQDGPKGIIKALPGVFGVGVQTYADQIPMSGKTATGKPNVQWRQAPGLGETILNKVTGTQISDIPKNQWQPLVDTRNATTAWNIKYSGIKANVLQTGTPQTVINPITNKTISIYLKDGVVTTKDITPKEKTTKKSTIKISKSKAPKKPKKPAKISISKVPAMKLSSRKFKIVSPKLAPPPKIKAYKAMKIKPIKIKASRKITLQKA